MSDRVLAYITAYEDPVAVQACLDGINQQAQAVEAVMIVDNSTLTPVNASDLKTNLPLIFQSHPENVGVAGGLRLALAFALEQEYDFLWAFDQDSIPTSTCLETLLKTYHTVHDENYPIAILGPTIFDTQTQSVINGANFETDQFVDCLPLAEKTYYECDAPITSGSLISLVAAQSVFSHSPVASLFIDGVDFEYGISLKQKGYHNLIVLQAKLNHRFGTPLTVQWWGKQKQFYQYSPLRHYYICRNYTDLALRYCQKQYRLSVLRRRFDYLLRISLKIYFFDNHNRLKKVLACWQGTFAGLMKHYCNIQTLE